jgi:hypothetical protein
LHPGRFAVGAVEKVFFNHKVHKEGTKYTKVKIYISALCDLCENTLRPLWLMDFNFFNSPMGGEKTGAHDKTKVI